MGSKQPLRPELLAPAGDWPALRAAVINGADAVYFGLQDFNARLRAANFSTDELPTVIAYLHAHNARGYVTLNTLVFPNELPRAAERLRVIAEAGADAVIVQDLGLVRLIRRLAPSLPIHASTQMTLTEPRGIELVRSLGVQRVILARELSLDEIRRIAQALSGYPPEGIGTFGRGPEPEGIGTFGRGPGRGPAVELEVFVHGALCISFSGQCLASLALGGRSGNRGLCAQACRLPYQVLAEGEPVPALRQAQGGPSRPRAARERRYPLSPQDLGAWDRVADLVALGVRGLKIEGRLKGAEYVAAAVRAYRAAIDAALAGKPFALGPERAAELAQGFSRGFTHGFLDGADHQRLVVGISPKGRGLLVGEVVARTPRGIVVKMAARADVKPGDGVVFEDPRAEDAEQGGRVVLVEPAPKPARCHAEPAEAPLKGLEAHAARGRRNPAGRSDCLLLVFRRGDVRLGAVPVAARVWKTDDPEVRKRLAHSYARDRVAHPEPLDLRIHAEIGGPLSIEASDAAGHTARVAWEQPLEPAERQPLTLGALREQLGRLGGTPFALRNLEAARLDAVMAPRSVLNALRRQLVEALVAAREAAARHPIADPDALAALRRESPWLTGRAAEDGKGSGGTAAGISILVRSPEQLDAVLGWEPPAGVPGPAMVYCDLRGPSQTAGAVARARAAGRPVGLASLRIIKPGDEDSLRRLAEARPDAILARNLAAVAFFAERQPRPLLVGDFSLNATNDLAAGALLALGLDRLVPGCDLGWDQLDALLRRVPPDRVELVIHQHVPMFHTQHCLFAAELSGGRERGECGRPCVRRVALRDRRRVAHPVEADAACRNTVFHASAASAGDRLAGLRRLGIRHFRLDLLRETPEQTLALLDRYSRAACAP